VKAANGPSLSRHRLIILDKLAGYSQFSIALLAVAFLKPSALIGEALRIDEDRNCGIISLHRRHDAINLVYLSHEAFPAVASGIVRNSHKIVWSDTGLWKPSDRKPTLSARIEKQLIRKKRFYCLCAREPGILDRSHLLGAIKGGITKESRNRSKQRI